MRSAAEESPSLVRDAQIVIAPSVVEEGGYDV